MKVAAGRRSNLAKCGTKGIRSSTLARVSVALALAFGLASGTSAKAAPPPGAPIENPFNNKGGDYTVLLAGTNSDFCTALNGNYKNGTASAWP